MTHQLDSSIIDDLFRGCAIGAFVEQDRARGAWPRQDATRRRANHLYGQALAASHKSTGLGTE